MVPTDSLADEPTLAATDARERASTFDRLSLASGIAASVLFLVGTALFMGVILPDLPAMDAPAAERAEFYAASAGNRGRGRGGT